MLALAINEAALMMEEGVCDRPQDMDLAMIYGTGFPPYRGGILRYADKWGIGNVYNKLVDLETAVRRTIQTSQTPGRDGPVRKDLLREVREELMAEKFVSRRNLEFLLYEVHGVERLSALPYFADHTRETYDLVMDTALKLARNLMYPYLREMDEKAPFLEDGQVKVHPAVKNNDEGMGRRRMDLFVHAV